MFILIEYRLLVPSVQHHNTTDIATARHSIFDTSQMVGAFKVQLINSTHNPCTTQYTELKLIVTQLIIQTYNGIVNESEGHPSVDVIQAAMYSSQPVE